MLTIAVIERGFHTTKLLKNRLAPQKYSIVWLSGGTRLLESLGQLSPDLLIVGPGAPHFDSPGFLQQLRADRQLGQLPMILLGRDSGARLPAPTPASLVDAIRQLPARGRTGGDA